MTQTGNNGSDSAKSDSIGKKTGSSGDKNRILTLDGQNNDSNGTLTPTLVTCLPVNYFVNTVAYEINLRIYFIVTLT